MVTQVIPKAPERTPRTSEELAAILKDKAQLAFLMEDPDKFKGFVADYTRAQFDQGIGERVEKAAAEGMAKFMERNPSRRLPMSDDKPTPAGKAVDGLWKTNAEFYKAIWHQTIRDNGLDPRLKDMSGMIGGDGGALVPERLRADLLQMSLETAVVRPRAFIVPMESLTVPFPVIKETTHATSVFGGFVGYWTKENTNTDESQPAFGTVRLEARELNIYTEVPNSLIADSIISLDAFLSRAMPQALAFFEDDAFIAGTGVGQPLGVVNAPARVEVAAEAGQPVDTVLYENIINMYARMLPGSHGRAVWVINQEVFPQLATMSLAVGTGGSAVWMSNGAGGPPTSILGRPVIVSEKASALGNVGDIMYVDFGYYLVGDRQMITMASSPHFKFQANQTVYRATERVDGQPWLMSDITPRRGTNDLSPFVMIAAR